MREKITRKGILLFSITLFLIAGCKDAGTSIEEIAPEIPDLSQAQISIDYFKGKVAPQTEALAGENFNVAANLATSLEDLSISFSTLPESFIGIAENVDATFDNGVWTWQYTSSGGGNSVTIRLTAEVKVLQTNWAMYISTTSEELTFDNYKFFDGFIKNTSNAGQWNFYSYYEASTEPVMTYDWEIEDESNATFTLSFGESSFSSMSYVKVSPDNTLTLTDSDSDSTTIYWNSTTGTGYIEFSDLDPICWDGSGNNVACPN